MKVNRLWMLLTIIATLTFALAGVGKASTAKIALDPPKVKDIDPGGTFTVDVTVTDVNNLYGWQFLMHFDPDVVQVDNVTEGPFLGSTGETPFPLPPTIDNDQGFVIAGSTFQLPFPADGVTGNGVLATIAFSVTGRGTINLEFDEDETLTYLSEVQWTNSHGLKVGIPVTLDNGTFSNGGQVTLSPLIIIAIVVAVALCGIGAFYYMRRRRT